MSDISCPLCDGKVSSDKLLLSQHFIQCGAATLATLRAVAPITPPTDTLPSPPSPSSPIVTPSSPKKRGAIPKITKREKKAKPNDEAPQSTPSRKTANRKEKAKAVNSGEEREEDIEEVVIEPPVSSPTSATKSKKITMTKQEYDVFLQNQKGGRFVRTGEWKSFGTNTDHKCTDPECAREWRPSPQQCMPEDYYCPSCVLHHRNNVDRFDEPRLAWTAVVPNTFYVFSLVDPNTKTNLIKFGRTQHADAWKRYPTKEVKAYQMKLIMTLRGKLITMTKIENWWKEHATEQKLFCRFSEGEFHGATECLELDDKTLKLMTDKSNEMHSANL